MMPFPMPGKPVVLDTSALIADILGNLAHGTTSILLGLLQTGTVHGYAAEHVWAEVPRILRTEADKGRVDRAAAEALWWDRYLPVIRFVDTDTLAADAAVAAELIRRDIKDLPTARLVSLLGPVPVLATDKDLIKLGLAHRHWKRTVHAGRDTQTAHQAMHGAGYLAIAAGAGINGTVRAIGRQLDRPGIGGFVTGIAAATALVYAAAWLTAPTSDLPGISRRIGRGVLTGATTIATMMHNGDLAWHDTFVGAAGTSLEARAARILGRSPEPMTRTQIAHRLLPVGTDTQRRVLVQRLGPVLVDRPAYLEDPRGRWALGRAPMRFR